MHSADASHKNGAFSTEGASLLGLSERQVWRLRRIVGEAGPAGLAHGNRGRPSPRQRTLARCCSRTVIVIVSIGGD